MRSVFKYQQNSGQICHTYHSYNMPEIYKGDFIDFLKLPQNVTNNYLGKVKKFGLAKIFGS